MKKIFTILSVIYASGFFAQASLPYNESFTYANGNLVNNGGWSYLGTPNTSAPDEIQVVSNAITFDGIGNDLQQTFATPVNSGSLSYSFDLKVTDVTAATDANGGYFAGFVQSASTYGGTIWTKKVTDTTYKLGVEVRTSTGTATSWSTADYNVNTTYNVVVKYTFNSGTTSDDTVSLWVDQASIVTDTHTGTDLTQASSFFFRQDSVTETPFINIDNLKISTGSLLSVSDINASKIKLVKNTSVNSDINFSEKANVKIYNMNGQVVKSISVDKNAILNVSSLPKGTYIVTGDVNGETVSQKIIKQ
ncbi:hypothetical protein GCM10010992_15930 [Cloacibacterium rupense]|uniref:Secretion system C-terminal sorting domain-containing protein n=1 Tax=Cloacibacterium rupense TaxID=517423 RepID=A0ABQ2NK74_9FLAO|nr:T9SS type A sorting domain-containing protein [Cloacibacterium rupense]GGP04321.1 hypothetical protein GCM10010992_15930 [Cloacibacterium rupense]